MSELDEAFDVGKGIVSERYGDFENEPEDFAIESGLINRGMAGLTRSSVGIDESGRITFQSPDAKPHQIELDEYVVEEHPGGAVKTLLHELIEWRAAEEMSSTDVLRGNTDYVAEFVENEMCREANDRIGEEVCDVEWGREYDT